MVARRWTKRRFLKFCLWPSVSQFITFIFSLVTCVNVWFFVQEFPVDSIINAGHVPPEEIVAVVRPTSFYSSSSSKNLDQKYIIKENFEMSLKIKFRTEERNLKDENHIYSARVSPSSRKGFHGLYIFPLICKSMQLFQRSGFYTFSFSIVSSLLSFRLCQYNKGYDTMIIYHFWSFFFPATNFSVRENRIVGIF